MKEKVKLYCIICNKLIGEFYQSQRKKTCSEDCYKKLVSLNTKGEKNPRYINGKYININYCKCGKIIDQRSKCCPKCKEINFKGKQHTVESKKLIGTKSSKKFTLDYKNEFRKKMEDNGLWIPLIEKDEFKFYSILSNWIERMFDLPNIEGIDKLKQFGVFNCRTNIKGVIRDHKFSRKSGFILKVFPEILRHPKNCEILLHSENVAKKSIRYKDKDSITLETLFNLIENYTNSWKEQDKCLEYIKLYRNGERYNKNYYIEEYYAKIKK